MCGLELGVGGWGGTRSCFDIDGPGRGEQDRLPQRTVEREGYRKGGELPEAALCFEAGTRKG